MREIAFHIDFHFLLSRCFEICFTNNWIAVRGADCILHLDALSKRTVFLEPVASSLSPIGNKCIAAPR
jgi:hypothetical protein